MKQLNQESPQLEHRTTRIRIRHVTNELIARNKFLMMINFQLNKGFQ
jgi:hypothetical protein